MLSNQWLTEIALRRAVTRQKTGNSLVTDFRVEKQYVTPVTRVTPKNNTGGDRFAVSREQKFEFVREPPSENANFPEARCCECRHGKPATANDPYSWHRCMAGHPGWWGMAARRCEIQQRHGRPATKNIA